MENEAQRLLELCKTEDFDTNEATRLISLLDVNEPVSDPSWKGHKTSFLKVCSDNTNLKMAKLLLENGADPNIKVEEENPFWNMQYNDYSDDAYEDGNYAYQSDEKRLAIAQLMLVHGADPCIVVEDEDLFSYVLYAVFNDDYGRLWEYRSRFFVLLVAYGGKNNCCKPEIIKPFDKNNMHKYKFYCVPAGDGYHFTGGEIVDEGHEVVARI